MTKKNSGRGTGESDKDEAGNDRDPNHAEKDLDGDDDMSVERRGIVMPVADGRQGFDTKEECVWERAWLQIGNTVRTREVKSPEEQVNNDVADDEEEREAQPAKRQDPVIVV